MKGNQIFFVLDQKRTQITGDAVPLKKYPVNSVIIKAIKLYFDACYLAFLSPFRFKWDIKKQTIVQISSCPQKFICFIVLINSFVWDLFYLRKEYPSNSKSANKNFHFFQSFFFSVFKLQVSKGFWFHQPQILQLLNYIIRIQFKLASSSLQKIIFNRCFQVTILLLKFSLTLWTFLTDFNKNNRPKEMLKEARAVLFLANKIDEIKSNSSTEDSQLLENITHFSASEIAFIVFGYVTKFHFQLYNFLPDFLFLATAILWTGASSFAKFVQNSKQGSWKQIHAYYKEVFYLAKSINNTISYIPLWWLATIIFFITNHVNILFSSTSSIEGLRVDLNVLFIYFIAMDFMFFYTCGDICSKVRFSKL